MIPYDIDPSLHSAEPEPSLLDDGFSAPRSHAESWEQGTRSSSATSLEEALAGKSDF